MDSFLHTIHITRDIDYYHSLPRLWKLCQDCYLGTPAIKHPKNANLYLPKTTREISDEKHNPHSRIYAFRLSHTTYENFFQSVINDAVGIMQKNPPHVSFSQTQSQGIAKEVIDISVYGNKFNDGLKGLKWRLNFNQALFGRYGLLLDIVTDESGESPRFVITEYTADQILEGEEGESRANGHANIKWIRLDETKMKFDSKTKIWRNFPKYRILGIDAQGYYYSATIEGDNFLADWTSFDFERPSESSFAELIYPTFRGEYLTFIPFTVCNATKIGYTSWQFPPFYDVATLGIGVYQMDSVYKKALWNHACPTLGIFNASLNVEENEHVYLGDLLELQSSGQYPADAKMLETSAAGLQEMRLSKMEMKETLKYFAIRDLLDGAGANSSGDAIELRTTSGTASIAAIDHAGALAIEEQLIYAAIWSGETPETAADKISYEADTSYLNSELLLQSVVSLINSNTNPDGTPVLSKENIYRILQKTLPDTLSSFEDNVAQAEKEVVKQQPQMDSSGEVPGFVSDDEQDSQEDEKKDNTDKKDE